MRTPFLTIALCLAGVAYGNNMMATAGDEMSKECEDALSTPSLAECRVTNNDVSSLCRNQEKCIEDIQKSIQKGCKNEQGHQYIRELLTMGIELKVKTTCVVDNNNHLCNITDSHQKAPAESSTCTECWPRVWDVVRNTSQKVAAEERDRMLRAWNETMNPCPSLKSSAASSPSSSPASSTEGPKAGVSSAGHLALGTTPLMIVLFSGFHSVE
jgi:hypothetical protein